MNPFWANIFHQPGYANSLAHFLGELQVFANLNRRDLSYIESLVHIRKYHAQETIFKEGDIGSGMYIIRSGQVQIEMRDESGNCRVQAELGTGDFFGEIALTSPMPRLATATAMESCILVGLFRSDLLDAIRKRPAAGARILLGLANVLSERLQAAGIKMHEQSYLHLHQDHPSS